MRVAVAPGPGHSGLLCELAADGSRGGAPLGIADLAAAISDRERAAEVRWVWPATARLYPDLLRAGVRVARCHDLTLTEALLRSRDGHPPGEAAELPGWLGAGPAAVRPAGRAAAQPALFEAPQPDAGQQSDPGALLDAVIAAHADQQARIARDARPAAFGLLVATESACGLAAAEMTTAGLPWQPGVHDALLTELLGSRPAPLTGLHPRSAGGLQPRPARLAELAAQISAALGTGKPVNPDSPPQLLRALAAAGVRVPSTQVSVLREVDHPVIGPLLEYKELSRLHAAFGWSWLDTWVSAGRFRPEYLVGGVVSGRWASRGGGALQIPRLLRRAVVADPGWVLVVADAAQLEPRVLAALAGDRAFAEAASGGDVYAALAGAFDGDRSKAKVALLSAMYGGAGGSAGQLLAVLRSRFPTASRYVEAAARAGEEGRVVRSVLGRSCPPPSQRWRSLTEESGDPDNERDPAAGRASRARGRFTRNFVVQASAADWAAVLLAGLRARLAAIGRPASEPAGQPPASAPAGAPELVFFQHDEVIVHCQAELGDQVAEAVSDAAEHATRLVFGATRVAFPMTTAIVTCYADAK
ncbi:MAG TPA: bifunctional 3'-5' exonuclease/DNA polymerase [Streptosporangiaceae bacterium]